MHWLRPGSAIDCVDELGHALASRPLPDHDSAMDMSSQVKPSKAKAKASSQQQGGSKETEAEWQLEQPPPDTEPASGCGVTLVPCRSSTQVCAQGGRESGDTPMPAGF